MKKFCMFAMAISLSLSLFAEIISVDVEKFGRLRDYVRPEFLELQALDNIPKKEKLAVSNRNKRTKSLNKGIDTIDVQIQKCKDIVKTLKFIDIQRQAYLVDNENNCEAFFINLNNDGWIDFFRKDDNIWIRCKTSAGNWLFYQAGPLFEKLVGDKYLFTKKTNDSYKSFNDMKDVSSKMKVTDTYYKSQYVYFHRMQDSRTELFKKFNKDNLINDMF